jgi:putative ABC transport system permease protein
MPVSDTLYENANENHVQKSVEQHAVLTTLRASLFLVYKALTRGNKGAIILTISVVALAFLQITFVSGIFSGAISAAYTQAKDNYVSNIIIKPSEDKDKDYIERVSSLKNRIRMIPGVISCSSHYTLGATVIWDVNKNGENVRKISWTVKSIDPDKEIEVTKIQDFMVAGQYLDKSDRDQVILGREISGGYEAQIEVQSLQGAKVGDKVTIQFNNGIKRDYKIKGIFATKFPLSDMAIFITEKEMESILGVHDRASEILVKTDASATEEVYISRLRDAGIVDEDIRPWTDFMGMLAGITLSFDLINRIVGFIGLLVAGVTIFIVIFIATLGRKKQIGISKAIGMDEKIIIISYVFQALIYTILGVLLGLLILQFVLIPYFNSHPLSMPMGLVTLSITRNGLIMNILGLIIVSLIAGFIPSWRIARTNIIEAIWG